MHLDNEILWSWIFLTLGCEHIFKVVVDISPCSMCSYWAFMRDFLPPMSASEMRLRYMYNMHHLGHHWCTLVHWEPNRPVPHCHDAFKAKLYEIFAVKIIAKFSLQKFGKDPVMCVKTHLLWKPHRFFFFFPLKHEK